MSFIPQPCVAAGCNCLLEAGTNVTITGDGSSGTPYHISASGGGGGAAELFFTVATPGIVAFGNAYATPANQFAAADFKTNGVTDNVGIQAAIDAAVAFAAPTGLQPTVYLLSGIYILGASLDTKGIQIKGAGRDFTQLYCVAGVGTPVGTIAIDNTISGASIDLEDLQIFSSSSGGAHPTILGTVQTTYRRLLVTASDSSATSKIYWSGLMQDCTFAGGGTNLIGGDGTIENCTVSGGIKISFDSEIVNSDINNTITLVDATDPSALRIVNSNLRTVDLGNNKLDHISIIGNKMDSFTMRGSNSANSSHVNVSHNFIGLGLHLVRADPGDALFNSNFSFNHIGDSVESDYNLFNCSFIGNTVDSITLTSSPGDSARVVVADNIIDGVDQPTLNGLNIGNGFGFTISGNSIRSENYGMFLQGLDNSVVNDNFINGFGDLGLGTFDGLFIDACDRLNVQGNTCYQFNGYGINVLSGNNNLVTNNDLKDGGTLGSFTDTATATITVAGNRL